MAVIDYATEARRHLMIKPTIVGLTGAIAEDEHIEQACLAGLSCSRLRSVARR